MTAISVSTYELLTPIVNSIDKTFVIDSVTDNTGGSYTLRTCNTLWATQGFNVTIDAVVYKITAIVPNVSITISGTSLPTASSFQLYPPVFYHGTVKSTDAQLQGKKNSALLSIDKLPLIWLHESTDETINFQTTESIARVSKCELYFMVDADFAKWTNDDHYTYAIKPMRNLMDAFMKAVSLSGTVNDNDIDVLRVNDFARWGVRMNKDGGEKTVFSNYEMSGSRMLVDLPFIRNNKYCC